MILTPKQNKELSRVIREQFEASYGEDYQEQFKAFRQGKITKYMVVEKIKEKRRKKSDGHRYFKMRN